MIQERPRVRNIDSKTLLPRFDYYKFRFHSAHSATFATKSANSGHDLLHSMTSSASNKNDSGSERPSALAALRLTTSSNLTGDCAGRLPGCSPLRMRSTYEADRLKISAVSGP